MSNILYVTTISSTINSFLVQHILYLISQGHKVDIATNLKENLNYELKEKGVKVYNISFSRSPLKVDNIKAYKDIGKICREGKYDIVHVHTPVAAFITRLAIKNIKNIKVIYTAHGFHFYNRAPLINWIIFYNLEKIASKWTDKIITINQEDFENASKFELRNNGTVDLINGVGIKKDLFDIKDFDSDNYRKKLGLNSNDFIILVLAELNKNKNHIQLIEAMRHLVIDYPNIKAIFAGDGEKKDYLKSYIEKYNLSNNIKLIGHRNDVKELLHLCDIVGLFSKREGLPVCILEAMLCNKPVIATNTRGPRSIIEHDKNGFLVEINDYENTSKYIETLYNERNIRERFKCESNKIINNYLIENILPQINEIHRF